MNIAILSVSEKGNKLSLNLKKLLENDPTVIKVNTFNKNVKSTICKIFDENIDLNKNTISDKNTISNFSNDFTKYNAIIGIMATGILVRAIAPKIQSKDIDPAVLSIDDNGKFVISLLSGHLGRANDLTLKIANLLNSEPVITTSTDINNKIGIDSLSNKYYWEIINKKEILNFNKRILEEKSVKLLLNLNKNEKIEYITDLNNYLKDKNNITLEIIDLKNIESSTKKLKQSDLSLNYNEIKYNIDQQDSNYNIIATFKDHYMFFKPKKIILGIGSRSNISKKAVLNAIKIAMNNLNLPIERIDLIGTAEIKRNEKGILKAIDEINKSLEIISLDEIREFKHPDISTSSFVKEKFNIPGVAEPSALILANKHGNNPELIHRKIAINGVTIAVAVSI